MIISISKFRKNPSKYIGLLETNKEERIYVSRYGKIILQIEPFNKRKPIVGLGKGIVEEHDFELKKGFEDIPELFGY